jgi:alkylhydroperoxidase family enzyme
VPHISLGNDAPGILSLFEYRPETAQPLGELAEVLLRGPSSLTRGERELIASYVSTLNDCDFCASSHAAFAAAQLPEGMPLATTLPADPAGYAAMADVIVSSGYGAAGPAGR